MCWADVSGSSELDLTFKKKRVLNVTLIYSAHRISLLFIACFPTWLVFMKKISPLDISFLNNVKLEKTVVSTFSVWFRNNCRIENFILKNFVLYLFPYYLLLNSSSLRGIVSQENRLPHPHYDYLNKTLLCNPAILINSDLVGERTRISSAGCWEAELPFTPPPAAPNLLIPKLQWLSFEKANCEKISCENNLL